MTPRAALYRSLCCVIVLPAAAIGFLPEALHHPPDGLAPSVAAGMIGIALVVIAAWWAEHASPGAVRAVPPTRIAIASLIALLVYILVTVLAFFAAIQVRR